MILNEVSQAQMSSDTYPTLRSLLESASPLSERENDKLVHPSSHAHNLSQCFTAAYNRGGVGCVADESSYDAGTGLCPGGVCVDTLYYVPTKRKTLSVPSGSEMVFHYGGQRPPKTVQINTRQLGKKSRSHPSVKAHGTGVERIIPAELTPGECVLDMFAEEQQTANQSTYYFRVLVK